MKSYKLLSRGPVDADIYEQFSRRNSFVDIVIDTNAKLQNRERLVNVNGDILNVVLQQFGATQQNYYLYKWKEDSTRGAELMKVEVGEGIMKFARKSENQGYEVARTFPIGDIKDALLNTKTNRLFLRLSNTLYKTLSVTTRNYFIAFFAALSGIYGPIDIISDVQTPVASVTKELQRAIDASTSTKDVVGYTKSVIAAIEDTTLIYEKPNVLLPVYTPLANNPLVLGDGQFTMSYTLKETDIPKWYRTTIQPSLVIPSLRKISDSWFGVSAEGLTSLCPYLLEQVQWVINRLNPNTSRRYPQKPKPAIIREDKLLVERLSANYSTTEGQKRILLHEPTYLDIFAEYTGDLKFDYFYDGKVKKMDQVQLLEDVEFVLPKGTDIRFLDMVGCFVKDKNLPTDTTEEEGLIQFGPYQTFEIQRPLFITIPKYTVLPIDHFAPTADNHTSCSGHCRQVIAKPEVKDGVAWLKRYLAKAPQDRDGPFLVSTKVVMTAIEEEPITMLSKSSMIITKTLQVTEPPVGESITEAHSSVYLPQIIIPEASPPTKDQCLDVLGELTQKADFLKACVKILLTKRMEDSKRKSCRLYCELLKMLAAKITLKELAELCEVYAKRNTEHCFEIYGLLQFWRDVANKEKFTLRLFDKNTPAAELEVTIRDAISVRSDAFLVNAQTRLYPELPVMQRTYPANQDEIDEMAEYLDELQPQPFYMGVFSDSKSDNAFVSTRTLLKIHCINVLNDPQTRVFFNQITKAMNELQLSGRLRDLPADGTLTKLKPEQKLPPATSMGNNVFFNVLNGNIFDKRLGGKHWSDEERAMFDSLLLKYLNASSRAAFLQMHRWLDLQDESTFSLEDKMAGAFMNALERTCNAYVPYSQYELEKLNTILPPSHKEQIRIYQRGQHYLVYRQQMTEKQWKTLQENSKGSSKIRDIYNVLDAGIPEHFFDIKENANTMILSSGRSALNFWSAYFAADYNLSTNKEVHANLYDLFNLLEYDVVNAR